MVGCFQCTDRSFGDISPHNILKPRNNFCFNIKVFRDTIDHHLEITIASGVILGCQGSTAVCGDFARVIRTARKLGAVNDGFATMIKLICTPVVHNGDGVGRESYGNVNIQFNACGIACAVGHCEGVFAAVAYLNACIFCCSILLVKQLIAVNGDTCQSSARACGNACRPFNIMRRPRLVYSCNCGRNSLKDCSNSHITRRHSEPVVFHGHSVGRHLPFFELITFFGVRRQGDFGTLCTGYGAC